MNTQKYVSNDFSIVIVTYNRPNELVRNFEYLKKLKSFPREVIVIDQSENEKTKEVCNKYKKVMKIIKYFHSKKPSITKSKNMGIDKSSNKSKIILFLDDDAFVGPNYLDEIVNYYNTLKDVNGVFGFDYENFHYSTPKTIKERVFSFIDRNVKRIFLLGYVGDKYFRVTSPYGNNSTKTINSPVKAEWFPGTNPSYKREILRKIKFDENFFWWSLGEDLDIGYRIHKKFGGLYVVPASISHKHPLFEDDYSKKIRKIYMNQVNHLYLFYKIMPDMRLKYLWNLFGIFLLRTLSLLQINNIKKRYSEWIFFIRSLRYAIKRKEKIRRGDLSIPS